MSASLYSINLLDLHEQRKFWIIWIQVLMTLSALLAHLQLRAFQIVIQQSDLNMGLPEFSDQAFMTLFAI